MFITLKKDLNLLAVPSHCPYPLVPTKVKAGRYEAERIDNPFFPVRTDRWIVLKGTVIGNHQWELMRLDDVLIEDDAPVAEISQTDINEAKLRG